MNNGDLVVVGTFLNQIEAELARGALEAGGIESLISADDARGLRPHLSLMSGVRLLVRVEDAEQAGKMLGESRPLTAWHGDDGTRDDDEESS